MNTLLDLTSLPNPLGYAFALALRALIAAGGLIRYSAEELTCKIQATYVDLGEERYTSITSAITNEQNGETPINPHTEIRIVEDNDANLRHIQFYRHNPYAPGKPVKEFSCDAIEVSELSDWLPAAAEYMYSTSYVSVSQLFPSSM